MDDKIITLHPQKDHSKEDIKLAIFNLLNTLIEEHEVPNDEIVGFLFDMMNTFREASYE